MTVSSMPEHPYGTLYVVATPLGNLADITVRAQAILAAVDYVVVEDTRRAKILLDHLNLKKRFILMHAHNEQAQVQRIIRHCLQNKAIALISDAGTPLISDPGFPLVVAAKKKGIKVLPIPGPCAISSALSVAGIPCHQFTFCGFLPNKAAAKRTFLQAFQHREETLVFFDSPRRLQTSVQIMVEVFGPERNAALMHEMTKFYERYDSAPLAQLLAQIQAESVIKGEWVLIVQGCVMQQRIAAQLNKAALLLDHLQPYVSLTQAINIVSDMFDLKRNQVYSLAKKCFNKNA
jgi:16S rRNA (cytidine1402-2'-O)-methyltransferase